MGIIVYTKWDIHPVSSYNENALCDFSFSDGFFQD